MGGAPFTGDVAINGDRSSMSARKRPARAKNTVDATGMAVSPGFINMLSWAVESLIADGRGLSDTIAGRHAGSVRRGQFDGPAQRRR